MKNDERSDIQSETTGSLHGAIVTGASRGIGNAVAQALAAQGLSIAINYSTTASAAKANELAHILTDDYGVDAFCMQADISNASQAQALADAAQKRFGRVDVLVNNAGIVRDDLIARVKDADFDRMVEVNLKGTFNCIRAVSRMMIRQHYGRIINMTSVVGVYGNAGQAGYAATKAGVIGIGKSAAKEFARRNVTVNMVAPGFIETDMTSTLSDKARNAALERIGMGRFGRVEDVAALVSFLASEYAGYITGQVIEVDGGLAL